MWDEHKHSRFAQLRQQQGMDSLTETERAELAHLGQELEAAEAGYLKPAAERLRQERQAVEAQNRALEALAYRKQALVQRLRDFLAETQAERRAIDGEVAAVLAGEQGAETDG